MADLRLFEQIELERFFTMEDGYFSDYSHRTLEELFQEYGVAYSELDPDGEELSKAKRVRNFWSKWPNALVAAVLKEAWERSTIKFGKTEESARISSLLNELADRGEPEDQPQLAEPFFGDSLEPFMADLRCAQQVIWMSMYSLKDEEIARTLHEKAKDGVRVELVLSDNKENRKTGFADKFDERLFLLWYPEIGCAKDHHKFVVIDGRCVWHGSRNASNAAKISREHFTRDRNKEVIDEFAAEFRSLKQSIWDRKLLNRRQ